MSFARGGPKQNTFVTPDELLHLARFLRDLRQPMPEGISAENFLKLRTSFANATTIAANQIQKSRQRVVQCVNIVTWLVNLLIRFYLVTGATQRLEDEFFY